MIRTRVEGPLAEIVLDRPEAGNALDRRGVGALKSSLDKLDASVELVLLRGAGGRAFCGGIDSREVLRLTPVERMTALGAFADCCTAVWEHPALTVAAVDGYAVGGGSHLAMACDLRVIAPHGWMQFPAGRYGLNLTATWLTLAAGPATATALLAGARRVGADEALRLGIATAVAPGDGALDALGIEPGPGLRATKAAVRRVIEPHVRDAVAAEHRAAVELAGDERFVAALSREASAGKPAAVAP
jgi:enoyl-CoA hydratase/carnithine racemase